MKYFKDYSGVDKDKEIADYAFVAIGDTTPIQKSSTGKILYLGDCFEMTIKQRLWDGKKNDLNHEALHNYNYTSYGTIKEAFINDEGFVDNKGKTHEASTGKFPTMYAICKLTKEGKELLKEYDNLTTSCFFTYTDDNGELAYKHGDDDRNVLYVNEITPQSLSFLTPDRKPRFKIDEPYVINEKTQDKKKLDYKNEDLQKSCVNIMSETNEDKKTSCNDKVEDKKEANELNEIKADIKKILSLLDLLDKKEEKNEDKDKEDKEEKNEDKDKEDKEEKNEDKDKEDKEKKNEDKDKEDKEKKNEDKDKEDKKEENEKENEKTQANSKDEKVFVLKGFVL